VSAPRRPDKPGGRPSAPSSSRPSRAGGKPARPRNEARKEGESAERPRKEGPAKTPRVRKDGSVASGRVTDRRARTEGAAKPERTPATRKPAAAAKPEKAPRVRKDGSLASGRDTDRRARTEGAAKPERTPAPRKPAAAAKPEKTPRVRQDGSLAIRSGPSEGHSRREPQRIAKLLARAGIASRREIERMIAEGRIALNGAVLDTPATILTSLAGVTVDGQPVAAPDATRLFLFHKPTGVLTAERDFSGRPTIYDRLPADLPRLVPIGRLDLNTEGLLLLTNDGELKRKLELPSSAIPRVYRARAYGEVAQEDLEALSEGIEIDGIRYGSIDANLERRTGRNVWIEMKITEGTKREVRRVLEHLGLQVSRLIRTAYGPFILADLPPGEVGEVKQHELVEFRKTLK
jgi:23S rRNA pseudouridine2605 synthase